MKKALVAAIVAAFVCSGTAQAATGWEKSRGTWISYHYSTKTKFENPRVIAQIVENRRVRAMRSATRIHIRKVLAQARRLLSEARAIVNGPVLSGGVWQCVAMAEEGGHNSIAGYFGFIYPPSSYPGGSRYRGSWLSIPYAAQLAIAEAVQRAYGWSAWGPLTRQKCGLG